MTYVEWRLYHLEYVALWSSELSGVFSLEVHYKVEVVPNVVLLNNVFVERHVFVLKGTSRETCACGGGEGVWELGG